MITPAFGLTATERVLPKLALDFTTAVLDARVTVTRTTNATNPATYINSSGVITAATNNQPRFDYDPATLLCRGLLIEESRANSLLNTDLLATQIVTVTAAVRTLSFYGTGSVTLSGAHVAVVSGTGAYPTRTTYSFTPSAGALTLTVAGTVQFAQLELGAFATSYIPTTTTSLTRNADAVSMTGTNFSSWYNATEGTFVLEYFETGINKTAAGLIANAGAYTDVIGMYIDGSIGVPIQPNFVVLNSNSIQANILDAAPPANSVAKMVAAYKQNSFAFALNGLLAGTDASGTIPTVNQLQIGNELNGIFANRHFAKVSYFPQRLTNAEVQAFSK